MTDWKRIYEDFDKLVGEEVDRLEELFKAIPKERLSAYFIANPYAKKVYEEKLRLELPPVKEACPIDGTPLNEVKRVPLFIRDPLRLSSEEEYLRAKMGLPLPTVHMEMIDVPPTMKVLICGAEPPHYFERDAAGKLVERNSEYIYRKILRERAKLERIFPEEEAPPTIRPRISKVPREALLEPPDVSPHDWIKYVKKIDDVTWWKKMTAEERKKILDEYERLCRENVEKRRSERFE